MWAAIDLVRRHWMFWLLLAGGLVLRGIAQIAYEPALLFIDSKKYIFGTDFTNTIWGSFDPLGYSLLILHPVGFDVNNVRNNDAHLVDPVDPADLPGTGGADDVGTLPLGGTGP